MAYCNSNPGLGTYDTDSCTTEAIALNKTVNPTLIVSTKEAIIPGCSSLRSALSLLYFLGLIYLGSPGRILTVLRTQYGKTASV